jgi:hypothetical protein
MLGAFLNLLPAKYNVNVWHIHDRFPPAQLHAFVAAHNEVQMAVSKPKYVNVKVRPPSLEEIARAQHIKKRMRRNARDTRFTGDVRFRNDTELVPRYAVGTYRVVFIYKDPVDALVSRYSREHCWNVQGDCAAVAAKRKTGALEVPPSPPFPDLAQYAQRGVDGMGLANHFSNYLHPAAPRNYPVVAINYHKLWDNLPAVMQALGLPASFIDRFPQRAETVRTGSADTFGGGGANATSPVTRELLRRMYRQLVEEIASTPAVLIV